MTTSLPDRALLGLMAVVVAMTPMSFGLSADVRTMWFQVLVVTLIAHLVAGRASFAPRVRFWTVLAVTAVVAALATADAALSTVGHRRAAGTLVILWLLAAPVVAGVVDRPVARRVAVLAFVAGQTVSAIVGAIAVLAGNPTLGATAEPDRAYGLAGHPNVFALGASVVCLWAAHRFPSQWSRASWALVGIVAVNGAGIVWSGSLSVALALAIALTVDLAVRRSGPRMIATFAAVVAGIVVGAAGIATLVGTRTPWSRLEQAVGQAELESSLSERWRTWGFAVREIAERPLHGTGLDGPSGVTTVNDLVVHQLVLRGWYQGGPLLGLAMVAVTVSCVVLIARAVRRGHVGPAPAVVTLYIAFASTAATLQQPYLWLVLLTAWFATAARLDDVSRPISSGLDDGDVVGSVVPGRRR